MVNRETTMGKDINERWSMLTSNYIAVGFKEVAPKRDWFKEIGPTSEACLGQLWWHKCLKPPSSVFE